MTTTIVRALADTNVVLRATIADANLHEPAKALIEGLWRDGIEVWISRQIIREYIVTLTRPQVFMTRRMTMTEVIGQVETLQSLFRVADDTAEVTARLIDTLLTANVDEMKRFEPEIRIIPLG